MPPKASTRFSKSARQSGATRSARRADRDCFVAALLATTIIRRHCERSEAIPIRSDQAPIPQAMALRRNVPNPGFSHGARKVGGVGSAGLDGRAARIAGLWLWPRAQ